MPRDPVYHMQRPEIQAPPAPDVLEFLFEEYKIAVKEHEEPAHAERVIDGASQFVEYARAYLENHRPRSTFEVQSNVGFVLTTGTRLVVSPLVESENVQGTMAPVAGVPIPMMGDGTNEWSYAAQGAVPITGFQEPNTKKAINYADKNYGKTIVDKTAKTNITKFKDRFASHDPFNPS